MAEYRRGLEYDPRAGKIVWQQQWHFYPLCEHYPSRNFAIRKNRPDDDELCNECRRRSNGQ